MKRLFLLISIASMLSPAFSQELTSTVRGTVLDNFTKVPLPGATVILLDNSKQLGTTTDSSGGFVFESIPTGRRSIAVSFIGYKSRNENNFIIASGKETHLVIELEEDLVTLDEVTVGSNPKRKARNDFAYVSGRRFNVEETEKYAGTNGDPARMASYFAGVMAAGDTRNDIIIRGNSPLGLLWRLEGVDIPNPNHFAAMGTNGGPICILNNNQLTNSDFMSGAFPSQYGNALSGVFDLNLRNGNNQKRETTIQMGSAGLEIGLEGYFSKKSDASYMINYRYAFLELFERIGINFNIPVIPKYQDLSYKLNFPTKRSGTFSLWGLGGKSNMEMYADENDLNQTKSINTFFGSNMGATGLTHRYIINEKSYVKTSLAVTDLQSHMRVDSAVVRTGPATFYGSNFNEVHATFNTHYKLKINQKLRLVTGVTYTHYFINFSDSAAYENTFLKIAENNGNYGLFQTYLQGEYSINQNMKLTSGLHYQYFLLNDSYTLEPRIAFNYDLGLHTSLSLGYGLHSQIQQGNVYFNQTAIDVSNEIYTETNRDLDFTKSHHFAAGISHLFNPNLKLNLEVYYQKLFNIPVETRASAYSIVNLGADYYSLIQDSLQNSGTGYNRGVELTLERFYYKGFYAKTTLSIFDSKYRGSDAVLRNTLFNNNYIVNILGGYEIRLPENQSLAINGNMVWAGGLRYIPIDLEKSIAEQQAVYMLDKSFEEKHDDFFKMNIKLIYRINKEKFSYETGFGINNITNRKNIMNQSFDAEKNELVNDYQMGLMPEGIFRIYF